MLYVSSNNCVINRVAMCASPMKLSYRFKISDLVIVLEQKIASSYIMYKNL